MPAFFFFSSRRRHTRLQGDWNSDVCSSDLCLPMCRHWDDRDRPNGDTWGGSGLAAVALWRWLEIIDAHGDDGPEEIDQVLKTASSLEEKRLYSGMMRIGLLPAMPLLEEDIAKLLAHAPCKNRRPEAIALFLDYLSLESSGELES